MINIFKVEPKPTIATPAINRDKQSATLQLFLIPCLEINAPDTIIPDAHITSVIDSIVAVEKDSIIGSESI